MSCPCICIKVLDYCWQDVCDSVDFDVQANVAGEYTLFTDFLGRIELQIKQTFGMGDQLIFPIDKLNENYQYTCEIIDPNGAQVTITKDNIQYDCFRFQTRIKMTA